MFEQLQPLPADPILNLLVHYRQDTRPHKVDLGVGVYKDETGQTPIMSAVHQAESRLLANETSKSYIGPAGSAEFNRLMANLLLGEHHPVLREQRLTVAQTPGGCGALRMAAELINHCTPAANVWVSDPTWANHIPLLNGAGLSTRPYPYYDNASKTIRFDAMLETLRHASPGDVVLLHGCCHNPSGADLSKEQWHTLSQLITEQGLLPFVDIAYQGLGDGLEEDAYGTRLLAEQVPNMLIALSCSKNFGLYRERTGAVLTISANAQQNSTTASNLFSLIRGHYSMPPAHGAAIVETILADPILTRQWQQELTQMRQRIQQLRQQLSTELAQHSNLPSFDFIPQQKGMFSFLGITPAQVAQLRNDHAIYMVDSSRINIAGLAHHNLHQVAQALACVLAK